MILIDKEIKKAVYNGEIEISDFTVKCLQPASYDLRIGEEGFAVSVGNIINIQNEGEFSIQPGDFVLLITHEKLRLPSNILGRFGLRSLYARMGLLATVGPQVDPGFNGKLVIGIVNFSSQTIRLPYLEQFCTLELQRLAENVEIPYRGPYQGQEHLSKEHISKIPKEPFPLAVMLIRQLIALSPSLSYIEKPPLYPEESSINNASFQREKRSFKQLKPELMETHRGQYVVIREGKAVLFGQNKTELAKQAYEKFGYGPLYIGLVEEEPEVINLLTPRIQGALNGLSI